jgi:uncharacterized protein YbbK (DUF523 family)
MIIPIDERIKVGVSASLLGQNVRYNGGHSRDLSMTDTLSQYVEFFPVFPEVACGFSMQREALRLAGDPESLAISCQHQVPQETFPSSWRVHCL